MPKTKGKLEINIKINQLPTQSQTIKRGWQRFYINIEGQIVQMKVRPRTWNKLLKANEEYPAWVASITGKMGHRIKNGFELLEPSIQVYEKKVGVPSESSPETPEE
ncbi:MAG: fertility inhibition FinO-like protein [Thioploca sp.]|nr:fertility inhibition FinO-like protein [Thioploca sp.]